MLLIDDRTPPPRPPRRDRPVWEPNWRMWGWIAAAVAAMAATFATPGLVTVLLTFAAVACAARAVVIALPPGAANGLREHRQ